MIPGWKDEIQQDYLEFLREHSGASPPEVAAHLNVSECCAVHWLTDLAREGKLRILAVELMEDGTLTPQEHSDLRADARIPR